MPLTPPLADYSKLTISAFGVQDLLVLAKVPATAAQSLVGKALTAAGQLTVAGHYYCLVPLSGISTKLEVILAATFTTATVTPAVNTVYYQAPPLNPSTMTTKTAAAGGGALTTTVRQTQTLTGMAGEQFCLVDVNITGTADVTFTQAEYNGL